MAWWQIALYVLTAVISYKLRPKPQQPRASTLEDIQVPTADETRAIPRLYGTKWIHGPNVLWYGDMRTEAITQDGARKYGLFGPKEKITVGYRYFLGLHLGLCHGPIKTILSIRADDREAWLGIAGHGDSIFVDARDLFGGEDREGGISGVVDVLMGTDDQTVNDYLAEQLPAPLPAFRGLTSLVARQIYVGTSTYIKNLSILASNVIPPPQIGGAEWSDWESLVSGTRIARMRTDGAGTWMAARMAGQTVGTNLIALYRSIDNGETWTHLRDFTAADDDISHGGTEGTVALAYGNGRWVMVCGRTGAGNDARAFISTDQGETWFQSSNPPGPPSNTGDLIFHNNAFVYIRGRIPTGDHTGRFVWTSLDGNVWLPSPAIENNPGNFVCVDSDGFGVLCAWFPGLTPSVLRSENGGATWEVITDGLETLAAGLISVQAMGIACGEFRGENTTWILCRGGQPGARSDDNGMTWEPFDWPTTNNINGVISDRRGNWVAVGDGNRVIRSIDNGQTWSEMTGPAGGSPNVWSPVTDRKGRWMILSASTQGFSYSLDGPLPDLLAGDANPADIIIDALTNRLTGLGYPEDSITTGDAYGSFDVARDLFIVENFGLSFLQNFQDSVEQFIQSVQEHVDAAVQVDPVTGKWIIIPIRDDYVFDELPIADPSVVLELVEFYRPGYGELINSLTVVYDDLIAAKERAITIHNNAVLTVQGAISAQTNNYPGITKAELASRVAARDLRQLSTPLARVELVLRPEFGFQLRVGGVFRFDWPPLGITGMVLRVISINYGDLINGAVRVSCSEDVFATARPLYETPPQTGFVPPVSDPQPVEDRVVQEVPYAILIRDIVGQAAELEEFLEDGGGTLMTIARPPTGDARRYGIYYRDDGEEFPVPFEDLGFGIFTRSAVAQGDAIGRAVSTEITFAAGVDLSSVAVGDVAVIGQEFIAVTSKAGQTITFARGVFDTVPQNHPAGSRVWFLDTGFGFSSDPFHAPKAIDVRLATEGSSGTLDVNVEEFVEEDSLQFNSRGIRPYPPGNFMVGGERYPLQLEFTPPITISWSHRDRVGQADSIVPQTADTIDSEDGVTYSLRVTGLSNTVHLDESGLNVTTYDLPEEALAEVGLTIELWSVRDGHESFQRQTAFITTATGLGFGLGLNLGGFGIVYEASAIDHGLSTTSAWGGISASRPVYCETNGLLYLGRAVIDPDVGTIVHVFPVRYVNNGADGESLLVQPGNYVEWFTVDAYLPSTDQVVGTLFRETVLTGAPFFYRGTSSQRKIVNKTTHALEDL